MLPNSITKFKALLLKESILNARVSFNLEKAKNIEQAKHLTNKYIKAKKVLLQCNTVYLRQEKKEEFDLKWHLSNIDKLTSRDIEALKKRFNLSSTSGKKKTGKQIKTLEETISIAKRIGINLDDSIIQKIPHSDTYDAKYLQRLIDQRLPFDKKRKTVILRLAKHDLPYSVIQGLIEASNERLYHQILNQLPPILLSKVGALKLKHGDGYLTKNSIYKAISTPMKS